MWLREESFALFLSSVRTHIAGLYVNRTLVQILVSCLFPPSALLWSLLTLLPCCHLFIVTCVLLFFFSLPVIFYTGWNVCASLLLPFLVPSILSFYLRHMVFYNKTFEACKKELNFQLSLLKHLVPRATGLMNLGFLWLHLWLSHCYNLISCSSFVSSVTSLLGGRRLQSWLLVQSGMHAVCTARLPALPGQLAAASHSP